MKEEQLIIVDKNDNELGIAPLRKVTEEKMLHRGSDIHVENSNGELLIHKRTMQKKIYPGHYDIAFGGAVDKNESYEKAAKRELEEESGLKDTELKFLYKRLFDLDKYSAFVSVFLTVSDGPFNFSKEEVEEAFFVSIEKLKEMIKKEKFCPDVPIRLKEYLKHKNETIQGI